FQRASLFGVYERQHAPDRAPVEARADRRAHSGDYRRQHAALVHERTVAVAAAAFWRLRRPAHADSLGAAGWADHRGARQRLVSVVGATAQRGAGQPRGTCMTRWRDSTWGIPSVIAGLGAVGLFAALLGDGVWDALAWLGLGIPGVVSVMALWLGRG